MVLSPIDEVPHLHVQTRFTPTSSRHRHPSGRRPRDTPTDPHASTDDHQTMPHPFSTRNIANATGPLSTTSIVFSMNSENKNQSGSQQDGRRKHFFSTPMARQNGFNDIFRKWEEGSVKSQGSVGSNGSSRKKSQGGSKISRKSYDSQKTFEEERGYRNHQALHRRVQSESTIPRMDDWMMNKLDKYEKFKSEVKKIELSPKKDDQTLSPQDKTKVLEEKKKKGGPNETIEKWQVKRRSLQQELEQQQQRDDVAASRPPVPSTKNRHLDKESRDPPRETPTHDDNYERTIQYYCAMGQNETLQKQINIQSREISSLHHKLEDMEQWYQSRLEEMEHKHREEMRGLRIEWEKKENDALQRLEDELNDVRLESDEREKEWMENKQRMEKEILLLMGENRSNKVEMRDLQTRKESLEKEVQLVQDVREENQRLAEEVRNCKVEIDKLNEAKEKAEGNCDSLDRDLKYHKSEREKMENVHQNRISGLIDEHQRESEVHQAMVANLMKEKERAFHELQREKAVHQAMVDNLMKEHEREKERAFREANEWKTRLQSIKRELEEEMTRNAVMAKEKNAMADMMEGYVSKMEEMHSHIRELKKEQRELMVIKNELEAENTRLNVLTKEKDTLGGVAGGYIAQMAELHKRNEELERETMLLKEELIDVLEVASRYQE
ncbi:hypothetical protein HJC23_011940 [Cyclotella cryptica]|uniref:Uncharacterized protein n=1 Tax=Cyclotella cryptica TaxID=29204 RepID=A0ABD3QUB7_9STRA|eukprot:CCRYP_002978-RA/>CCRYP_002978-RA protein AED:0.09 eAED:0.09 QI:0/-1/0/1/-1/1/1/0/667